ncbi:MAG: ribonuclease HI family protein [Acidobacteria bacterium]|uniref:Ribonuclease HI family protein n=1 Tax=Candidatus Polarisedimenticola svalbardensis TaxID=2886004 RepID=A0A8J6XY74_9BACT|nr:ribonuclease HI family protein [Candidatus Polarisedimenticola svalbardensis]
MTPRFRAAFDGGSRGNPGIAAWGVAVLDEDHRCLEGYAGGLGKATNNVAEYNGLIEALDLALERGAEDVALFSDSQLIVRQINGQYKVRHPDMIPLYRAAKKRITKLALFRLEHVRRENNKDADRMVNLALDQGAEKSVRIHEVF